MAMLEPQHVQGFPARRHPCASAGGAQNSAPGAPCPAYLSVAGVALLLSVGLVPAFGAKLRVLVMLWDGVLLD